MSDALDQAAAAFGREIGAPGSQSKGDDEKPTERMFDTLDDGEDGGEEGHGPEDDELEEDEGQEQPDNEEEEDPEKDEDQDDDEDGEDEGEDEEEDDEDDDPELNKKFVITVDGEETEVTLREALNGYIRQETFHRRLNAVTKASEIVQQEAARVIADRQKYITKLEDLEKQLQSLIPQEPDWDALYKEDPVKAREIEKQYRQYVASVEQVRADREKARKEAELADAQATAEFAKQEFPKFAKLAKWKSQKDAEKDLNSMRRTALAAGFTEEEMATVYDSRMLYILLKASKYDRMMAAKPRPVKDSKKPKKAKGAGRVSTAPKGNTRALKSFAPADSIENAARVFHRVIQS